MESSHGDAIEEPAAESPRSANGKKRLMSGDEEETEEVEEQLPRPSTTNNATNHATTSPSISFVVMGFGPFGGVPENPTMMLVNGLPGYLTKNGNEVDLDQKQSSQQQQQKEEDNRNKLEWLVPRIRHCQVIETSAGAVEEALQTLHQELLQSTTTTTTTESSSAATTILLHFGVNWKGTVPHTLFSLDLFYFSKNT
jgi:hypothetical protein